MLTLLMTSSSCLDTSTSASMKVASLPGVVSRVFVMCELCLYVCCHQCHWRLISREIFV
jgi:hypothetical protein